MKEYEMLRSEIMQKIELYNSLITFTITTVLGILTLAITTQKRMLFLLTFCIIIPMSLRIAYYKTTIVKISAYMIVFLESKLSEFSWETKNRKFMNVNKKTKIYMIERLQGYECFVLSVVSYILYCFNYLQNKEVSLKTVFDIGFPFLLVLFEMYVTWVMNSIEKNRDKDITNWENVSNMS